MDCSHIQFQYNDTLEPADLQRLLQLFKLAAFWAQDRTREDLATAIAQHPPF
jgi:hypothetical protein